ncbi:hypothetical protein C8R47DRAFT_709318 [Mycena vitilis]|nr:hypothetical protein C8R47DRAFT_709318 [Mycena vitilis]
MALESSSSTHWAGDWLHEVRVWPVYLPQFLSVTLVALAVKLVLLQYQLQRLYAAQEDAARCRAEAARRLEAIHRELEQREQEQREQDLREQARREEGDRQADLQRHEQARREAERAASEAQHLETARRAEVERRAVAERLERHRHEGPAVAGRQLNRESTAETLFTCCICMDTYRAPVVTMCVHIFCEKCVRNLPSAHCPLCRTPLVGEYMRDALFERELANAIANGLVSRREPSFLIAR